MICQSKLLTSFLAWFLTWVFLYTVAKCNGAVCCLRNVSSKTFIFFKGTRERYFNDEYTHETLRPPTGLMNISGSLKQEIPHLKTEYSLELWTLAMYITSPIMMDRKISDAQRSKSKMRCREWLLHTLLLDFTTPCIL